MTRAPIVFLTDFGTADGYPGVMKGVVYSYCPDALVVDLTHEISPQNLPSAAFLLQKNFHYFPQGSIFVAVVDPGVGSERKIIYLEWRQWRFLAPDNGLLTPFLLQSEGIETIREVTQSDLFIVKRGNTFDGRDRFAPVAARLAAGFSPEEIGPILATPVMIPELLPHPRMVGHKIVGQVIHIDTFGNLITTIEGDFLQSLEAFGVPFVSVGGQKVPIVESYSAVQPGDPLAVIGGFGTLEIAVNQGSARRMLRVPIGQTVEVLTHPMERSPK